MSYGLVMCSECKREVHQTREADDELVWKHCEDGTVMCYDGSAVYPQDRSEVKGRVCGRDDLKP